MPHATRFGAGVRLYGALLTKNCIYTHTYRFYLFSSQSVPRIPQNSAGNVKLIMNVLYIFQLRKKQWTIISNGSSLAVSDKTNYSRQKIRAKCVKGFKLTKNFSKGKTQQIQKKAPMAYLKNWKANFGVQSSSSTFTSHPTEFHPREYSPQTVHKWSKLG